MPKNWNEYREKIIGLGDDSFKKSYYPELQNKINELEQANLNLRTIFNSTNDSIIIHDKHGKIFTLNPEAEKTLNLNENETENSNLTNFSTNNQSKNQFLTICKKAFSGKSQTFEWIIKQNETLEEIPVQISVNKTTWYGNQVLVSVIRDFTERKKFEKELIEAKENAKESDKLKSAFLANMSHEIRTPMNGIIGFSRLITNSNLSKANHDLYSKIIINSSNQLLNIVNDIMDISMIESNTLKLNIQNVNINDIINELHELFYMQNKRQNIELKSIKSLSDEESIIPTDKGRLNQILSNLLNNAYKFTKKGTINFGYVVINNNIQFFVQDTGIGIPKNQQEKVFERFRQAELDNTRDYGGTGLGLSLSKRFVELLGGKIWLESEEKKGSKFFFTIPFESVKTMAKESTTEMQIKKQDAITILITEDEEINYLYLKEVLSKLGANLIWAKNGKDAVTICRNNPNIDLVLMDIKMPIMNGYDATRAIKKIRPNLPIIAQTAYAMIEDKAKAKNAGCDDYISKPISMNDLIPLISKIKTLK